MPGVMILEALAQTAGILAFVTAGVMPDENTRFYFVGHRQGALPQAGRAGRPARSSRPARAQPSRASGSSPLSACGRRGGGARRDDGGAGDRQDSARRPQRDVIDPRAIVSPKAELARGCHGRALRHHRRRTCSIGAGTVDRVRTPSSTARRRIGADNRIFQFASIGDAPQDKKYAGEPTRLEIGDRNVFREFCTINRGTTHGKGVTTHRQRQPFMAYSHVAHDCVRRQQHRVRNCATLGGHVRARRLGHHGRLCRPSISSARSARMRSSRTTPPSRGTCRRT